MKISSCDPCSTDRSISFYRTVDVGGGGFSLAAACDSVLVEKRGDEVSGGLGGVQSAQQRSRV